MDEIILKLYECLSQMDISAISLADSSNLFKDLGLDSLDVVELLVRMERKFKIEIPLTDFDSIQTIKDLKNLLNNFFIQHKI